MGLQRFFYQWPGGDGLGEACVEWEKKACQADALAFVRSGLYAAALPQQVVFFVH